MPSVKGSSYKAPWHSWPAPWSGSQWCGGVAVKNMSNNKHSKKLSEGKLKKKTLQILLIESFKFLGVKVCGNPIFSWIVGTEFRG